VTLQLEVVKRLLAAPATEDYGLLTLLLQLRYEPTGWFKLPANCFFPQPNVDSACLTLVRRPAPLLNLEEAKRFTRLVKIAFGQRRKMMFKLLTAAWPEAQLEAAFAATGIARTARAEQVGLEQFVALTRALAPA
jgi:16S rRNA (adenine1518-N6/adenine1519-N6)-dimethyltransferase